MRTYLGSLHRVIIEHLLELLSFKIAKRIKYVEAISPFTYQCLIHHNIPAEKILLTGNGERSPLLIDLAHKKNVIVAIGQIRPHRRFDLILKVFKGVLEKMDVKLILIGNVRPHSLKNDLKSNKQVFHSDPL